MRKKLLTRKNALIVGVLAVLGIGTQSCEKYGIIEPDFRPEEDSIGQIVCKYGVLLPETGEEAPTEPEEK